jgi:hypothetical protein
MLICSWINVAEKIQVRIEQFKLLTRRAGSEFMGPCWFHAFRLQARSFDFLSNRLVLWSAELHAAALVARNRFVCAFDG